tara:strand:- start:78 stop:698 length:621 start_codon:yes stop_codon:yes gene_type:complete
MEKPINVIIKALDKFNTENLSQLLFDNKSEIACNQRLCVAINKGSKDYLARVEYTNKADSVSRADLVLINKKTGKVDLCIEAKTLAIFNILSPTKGEMKKGKSHFLFHNLKKNLDKHGKEVSKASLMWVFGWELLDKNPERHLQEKYFQGRRRKGMELKSNKQDIRKKIRDSFREAKLGKDIKQKTLYAKDEHEGYKAFVIATLGN